MNMISDHESTKDYEDDLLLNESDFEDINISEEHSSEVNACIESHLSAMSFAHGVISSPHLEVTNLQRDLINLTDTQTAKQFNGLMIDTGANISSVMSVGQYSLYCKENFVIAEIDRSFQKILHGVGGTAQTIGQVRIVIPMPALGIQNPTMFHIVDAPLPSILLLRDLRNMGVEPSIQKDCLTMKGKKQPLKTFNGLLYYVWNPPDVVLYTETELRKLHRSFGHPSVGALSRMLVRARPEASNVVQELESITKECSTCQKHAVRPRRFKLTVGHDDAKFNHVLAIDIFYINGKPILHYVDEATQYASARFLSTMSSSDVWKTLMRCWILAYLGPPDFLRVDKGSNFVSKEFKSNAE